MALILFDLDGTILLKGKVQEGILEAIRKLKEQNHEVAIATGRSPVFLDNLDKILGVDNMILSNGAYVVAKGDVVFQHSIPGELVQKMMRLSDAIGFDLGIVYEDSYRAYRRDGQEIDTFSEVFQIMKPKLDRKYHPDKMVFAMQIFDHNVIPILSQEIPELIFNRSNKYGFDVNLKGDLKADGARVLIDFFQTAIEDVYAFGDGMNDISMIKLAGHGVAMGNAFKQLKEVAEYITDDVDKNGVINALKHYNLL